MLFMSATARFSAKHVYIRFTFSLALCPSACFHFCFFLIQGFFFHGTSPFYDPTCLCFPCNWFFGYCGCVSNSLAMSSRASPYVHSTEI